MDRSSALAYVSYVADDALSFESLSDENRVVLGNAVLVGWRCGFEPLFVAVHSYLGCELTDEEVVEIATDGLKEIGWFADNNITEPDYILSP